MRTALGSLLCFAATALGGPQVSIDLTGLKIQNGLNQAKSSTPQQLDPSTRYGYSIDGMVKGSGGVLGILYPSPTPIKQVLADLGADAGLLSGEACSASGTHPIVIVNQLFEGEGDLGGISATFKANFKAEVDAGDIVSFSITNVVISPSFLVGSMQFTSGAAVIDSIACPPDVEGDGDLDIFDFLAFQNEHANQTPRGDFECDGDWDVFDFLAFQGAYAEGC